MGVKITAKGNGYAGAFGGGGEIMYKYNEKTKKRNLNFGINLAALFGVGGKIEISW